jgi:polyhydroxyalkanoate synthase subunit PhaC
MHSFYLRKMYHENRLAIPGEISFAGVAIDLTQIKTPTFLLSTREDQIAPWQSTYAATQLYKGPIKFVLADPMDGAALLRPRELVLPDPVGIRGISSNDPWHRITSH